jgi:hypothetical protein
MDRACRFGDVMTMNIIKNEKFAARMRAIFLILLLPDHPQLASSAPEFSHSATF